MQDTRIAELEPKIASKDLTWDQVIASAGLTWDQVIAFAGLTWDQVIAFAGLTWDQVIAFAGLTWDQVIAFAGLTWDQVIASAERHWEQVIASKQLTWDQVSASKERHWEQVIASKQLTWDQVSASKELQWEAEKDKILKALKTERAIRKKAEAALKAVNKEKLSNTSSLDVNPSPADEKALLDMQKLVKDLEVANAALTHQMTSNALTWEADKARIMAALVSERKISKQAREDKNNITKTLQEEKIAWNQQLLAKQEEVLFLKRQWSATSRQAEKCNEERLSKFKETKLTLIRKVNQVVEEKNLLFVETEAEKRDLEARCLEREEKIKSMDEESTLSEAGWKSRITALEEQMSAQLALKEDHVKQMEDNNELLNQKNIELQKDNQKLQELSVMTDKEKAKIQKEAKKAAKEAEKTQKREEAEKIKSDAKEQKRLAKERKLRERRGEASE